MIGKEYQQVWGGTRKYTGTGNVLNFSLNVLDVCPLCGAATPVRENAERDVWRPRPRMCLAVRGLPRESRETARCCSARQWA
jgi:hypothetical protein